MILVHQLMSPPFCLPETAPIEGATRFLLDRGVHGAPVINREGRAVGVVSLTDLLSARISGAPTDPVSRCMTSPPITVEPGATIYEAARAMVHQGVHRLVIVDVEGHPVGVLTPMDILAGLVNMPGGGVFRRLVTNEDVAAGVAVDVLGATTDLLPDQDFLP